MILYVVGYGITLGQKSKLDHLNQSHISIGSLMVMRPRRGPIFRILNGSFAHSLLELLVHPPIQPFIQLFVRSFVHSFIICLVFSFISFVSFIRLVIQSFSHSVIQSFSHSFSRLVIHSFIHWFIHPSIHLYHFRTRLQRTLLQYRHSGIHASTIIAASLVKC